MLDESFYLDGVDARSVGIVLQEQIEISEPVPIIDSDEVDGRNGNLLFYSGSYENRECEAACYVLGESVANKVSAINKFLLSKRGYRRLELSSDPDHYYMACVLNGAMLKPLNGLLNGFNIEFECKPQRFLKDGDLPVVFEEEGVLENPYGFSAAPIVKIYGNGSGTLNIGNYRVDVLSIDDFGITLDSDTMNAYNNNGNQNKNINAPEFPLLVDGENAVSFSGNITRVEILPRWWEL
jgi:phage-related protein